MIRWLGLVSVMTLLLGPFAASADAQSCAGWIGPVYPGTPLQGRAMCYDSDRGVAILFGGFPFLAGNGIEPTQETWEWDGAAWALRGTEGPSPRWNHAMAYDSARGVAVLFGGSTDNNPFTLNGETWEWNGSTWTLRAATGPSPRANHAMAYDSLRGVTVLFGGSPQNDTWEWDGQQWTLRSTTGPTPRSRHAMAFDAARGVTTLFGGQASFSKLRDTWEWDGSSWTERIVELGPSERSRHAMWYDSAAGRTLLFGGSESSDETWSWDGREWSIVSNGMPSARYDVVACYDSNRGAAVLFGGADDETQFVETWEYSNSWELRGSSPARYDHAMAYDSRRGVTVLYGGLGENEDEHTWEWDGARWYERVTPQTPGTRWGHAMAHDRARGVTVLFGGSETNRETWEWDGTTWTLKSNTGPAARRDHAMAYDSARGVTVLFGGKSGCCQVFGDTWEWDGQSWVQRATSLPDNFPNGYRVRHAMSFDSARGVVVMFGGSPLNNQTWEWNGSKWTRRADSGPPARRSHAMAYDEARGVTVLFGGSDEMGVLSEAQTWEWDGNMWHARPLPAPSPRRNHAMAYDAARGVTLSFGGEPTTSTGGETWLWDGGDSYLGTQPRKQTYCDNGGATFSVTPVAHGPVGFQWRKDGVDLVDGLTAHGSTIAGSAATSLTITNAKPPDIGVYDVVVTSRCGVMVSDGATLAPGLSLPLSENWLDTSFDPQFWSSWTGAIDVLGPPQPSPPYALQLKGTEYAETNDIDLSTSSTVRLRFWWARSTTFFSDDLLVFFHDDAGEAVLLDIISSGPNSSDYSLREMILPAAALHCRSRIRFQVDNSLGSSARWYVDDIELTAISPADALSQAAVGNLAQESPDATPSAFSPNPSIGPDVIVGSISTVNNYAPSGSIRAYSVGTTACNVGDENLLWLNGDERHPVVAQNLYRLMDGRFEQIGMSWVKHGTAATAGSFCGSCSGVGGSVLGVGCSDVYSATANGLQVNMGPRSDVNASTGEFPFPFTFNVLSLTSTTNKRLQVQQDDVDPALNPGALYFVEGHCVAKDDAAAGNHHNNASYRRATFDSAFVMTLVDDTQVERPAIMAWRDYGLGGTGPDAGVELVHVDVPGGGRFWVGAKATSNGDGTWHYQYAIQNFNSHRSAGSVRVPIPAGAIVTNVGFDDCFYHTNEVYDNSDWVVTVHEDAIQWSSPQTFDENPNTNALRWSTLYNFRFDADVGPAPGTLTLELFRPGDPASVSVAVTAPGDGGSPCPGDLDGDKDVDIGDLGALLQGFGCVDGAPESPCPGDSDRDGDTDLADLGLLLQNYGCTGS